jgi:AraC-like DNA-binding protein
VSINTRIRQLYRPIQPTVRQADGQVSYAEFLPFDQLYPFIFYYWQLKSTRKLDESFNYRVVADGCIDIFFEFNDPSDSYVMGFCKKFTEFPLGDTFNYVGVRFLPGIFPLLFNISAKEISNQSVPLVNVLPEVAGFISRSFQSDLQPEQIKKEFDNYFIQLISGRALNPDNRFYEAIQLILEKRGVIDIENELDTGISPRQLRRLFEYYIGDTAKVFSKVVRFQHILNAKPSSQSLRKNKLFFSSGYYDQAHFIKEFKNFYGVTPAKAFGR